MVSLVDWRDSLGVSLLLPFAGDAAIDEGLLAGASEKTGVADRGQRWQGSDCLGWVKPGNSGRIKRIKREEYGRNKAAQVAGLRDAEQRETRGLWGDGSCMQRTLQLGVRLCFSHARRPRLVFGGPLGLGRGAGVVGGGARARGRAVWRRRRGGGLQDGHLAMAVPGSFPCSSRWRIRGRLGRSGDFRRSRAVFRGGVSVG